VKGGENRKQDWIGAIEEIRNQKKGGIHGKAIAD
jgi:hypothetical protein